MRLILSLLLWIQNMFRREQDRLIGNGAWVLPDDKKETMIEWEEECNEDDDT